MDVSLATVSDLNSEGWGVVRTEAGEVVFVPGAWPGDEIEFSILKRGKFTLGKLEKILKKSSAHRENICPSRDTQTQRCVACPWAGIHYKDQLEAKNKKIDFLINRFKFAPKIKNPILPSPEEFHYRNRVKLHREEKSLGYKDPVTLKFNPISECKVVEEWINLEIKKLSSSLDENSTQEIWIQKGQEGEFNQGNTRQNNQIKEILQKEKDDKAPPKEKNIICGDFRYRFLKQDITGNGVIPTLLTNLLKARKDTRKIIAQNKDKHLNLGLAAYHLSRPNNSFVERTPRGLWIRVLDRIYRNHIVVLVEFSILRKSPTK